MRLPCQKRAKENQKRLQGVVIGCDFDFFCEISLRKLPSKQKKRAQIRSLKIETSMVNGKGQKVENDSSDCKNTREN